MGLPPTLEEIDAFVADKSPGAWEKAVKRLLASPHTEKSGGVQEKNEIGQPMAADERR